MKCELQGTWSNWWTIYYYRDHSWTVWRFCCLQMLMMYGATLRSSKNIFPHWVDHIIIKIWRWMHSTHIWGLLQLWKLSGELSYYSCRYFLKKKLEAEFASAGTGSFLIVLYAHYKTMQLHTGHLKNEENVTCYKDANKGTIESGKLFT